MDSNLTQSIPGLSLLPIAIRPSKSLPKTWSAFPAEIKAKILFQLDQRSDLKACRLADKKTSGEATRLLFQTLQVSPSWSSVTRLSKIAHVPLLASCVQALEFHKYAMKHVAFEDAIQHGRLADRIRSLAPIDAALLVLRLSAEHKNELCAQHEFEHKAKGITELERLIPKFPRLDSMTVSENYELDGGGFSAHKLVGKTSDLFLRTGMSIMDPYDWTLHFFNLMSRDCKPKRLRFSSVNFWTIDAVIRSFRMGFLDKVIHFKLTLELFSLVFHINGNTKSSLESLKRFMCSLGGSLPAVEELWLGFDKLPIFPTVNTGTPIIPHLMPFDTAHLGVSDNLSSQTFNNLKTVTLDNLYIQTGSLLAFVDRHTQTLKSLTLRNVALGPMYHGWPGITRSKNIMPLVIQVIMRLRDKLHLESFTLEGDLHDTLGNVLKVCKRGRGSLLYEVEQYVCHRGEFPFVFLAPYLSHIKQGMIRYDNDKAAWCRNIRGAVLHITTETDESWMFPALAVVPTLQG
ncbi:hypothetical protein H2200_000940 [Cladophialophora chaetospira]|uniref:Uncharacterized protein n=1 Tax=Cladophialophora chaetospira TaxID=386627 RepID=A0AA38XQH8_9EURO|nr:hypothetical protein H2200_000940 [Cladophialophora chaetospira]